MSKIKTAMAGLVLGASALTSGQALAEVSGSLNITSEYMFRGIVSEGGAAVQGSLDWSDASGIYAGAWASNAAPAGGTELDLYVGWATELSQGVGLDLGLVYYGFTEENEVGEDYSYAEIYAGLSLGGLSGSIYYTDDYFGVDGANLGGGQTADGEAFYYTVSYTHGLSDTLDLSLQIGLNDGDGVEAFIGDEYTDWSISLSKDLGNGAGVSFAYVQTDLDDVKTGVLGDQEDDAKFVISASKEFSL